MTFKDEMRNDIGTVCNINGLPPFDAVILHNPHEGEASPTDATYPAGAVDLKGRWWHCNLELEGQVVCDAGRLLIDDYKDHSYIPWENTPLDNLKASDQLAFQKFELLCRNCQPVSDGGVV
jgi:hypothetical protein